MMSSSGPGVKRHKPSSSVLNRTSNNQNLQMQCLSAEVESLTERNKSLSLELEELQSQLRQSREQNGRLKSENFKLKKDNIETNTYKTQVAALNDFISKQSQQHRKELDLILNELAKENNNQQRSSLNTASSSNVSVFTPSPVKSLRSRNNAVEDRLKELQSENLELRRRLAGLTPHLPRYKTRSSDEAISFDAPAEIQNDEMQCSNCQRLQRQKNRQADYFHHKLVAARKSESNYKETCHLLGLQLTQLRSEIEALHKNFQVKMDQLSEKGGMYKERSKRLKRMNSAQLKGFRTDVHHMKQKVQDVEKQVLKTQLYMLDQEYTKQINQELSRLVRESKGAETKIKSLERLMTQSDREVLLDFDT